MDSGLPGPRPPGALRASKIAPGDFVEPTNTVRCYTLSRRAPSTARPPLLAVARVPERTQVIKSGSLPAGGLVRGSGLVARRDIVASVVRTRWWRYIGNGRNHQRAGRVRRVESGGHL